VYRLPDHQTPPVQHIPPLLSRPYKRSDAEAKLLSLSTSPTWDWECFRGVLICLATIGEGHYIPATRRPDWVLLSGLQTTIQELRQISTQRQGRETSRVVFVDRDRSCLLISGRTRVGTATSVRIDTALAPGGMQAQVPVLSIHVHPDQPGSVGLSDLDYVSFLSDPRHIIMMICYPGGILFAMKTSATLAGIPMDIAQGRISVIRTDIFKIFSSHTPDTILIFNKAVCMEFGLTLYKAPAPNENVARRIDVTRF
jgi:hypothetical protein